MEQTQPPPSTSENRPRDAAIYSQRWPASPKKLLFFFSYSMEVSRARAWLRAGFPDAVCRRAKKTSLVPSSAIMIQRSGCFTMRAPPARIRGRSYISLGRNQVWCASDCAWVAVISKLLPSLALPAFHWTCCRAFRKSANPEMVYHRNRPRCLSSRAFDSQERKASG